MTCKQLILHGKRKDALNQYGMSTCNKMYKEIRKDRDQSKQDICKANVLVESPIIDLIKNKLIIVFKKSKV